MRSKWFFMLLAILFFQLVDPVMAESNQKIYDYAELLTEEERDELESLSTQYSEEREVDIVVLTIADSEGLYIIEYSEDFYDEFGLGYDKSNGDTVILAVDMENRDVHIAGYYKGKDYIDDRRANLIREEITPDLSDGYYYDAFVSYIELTNDFLGVYPENLFQQLWFQMVVSLIVASIVVAMMLYRSSGRMTVNEKTYLDLNNSVLTSKRDTYLRTKTTKVKKPSNKGSGGGMTKGGHSHSGSVGKF